MITPNDALATIPASWKTILSPGDVRMVDLRISSINGAISQATSKGASVYPWANERFKALELTAAEATKVVIIGQDPYHNLCTDIHGLERPQAMGLSFSVPKGAKIPPSLKNIFKELRDDVGVDIPKHGDLSAWAREGVLLLNSYLSVEHGKPGSHADLGWDDIVKCLIQAISSKADAQIAFVLWGKHAQKYEECINNISNHLIIKTSHPSPIGGACNRGFFGSKPFSKVNEFLALNGKKAINWASIDLEKEAS